MKRCSATNRGGLTHIWCKAFVRKCPKLGRILSSRDKDIFDARAGNTRGHMPQWRIVRPTSLQLSQPDFVEGQTLDDRKFRMLTVFDAFSHESLAIEVASKLNAHEVLAVLANLFIERDRLNISAPIMVRSS